MKVKEWTEQEDKSLRKLLLKYPFPLIAIMLNRTEEECKERIKVKDKRWFPTAEEKDLIMALSPKEAARLFGVNQRKIWLHRSKIREAIRRPPKPPKPPSKKAKKLIAAREKSFREKSLKTATKEKPPSKAKYVPKTPKPPSTEEFQQTVEKIKKFEGLDAGQLRQALMIAKTDGDSAIRYCQMMSNEVKEDEISGGVCE